jgi:hypothetical protein
MEREEPILETHEFRGAELSSHFVVCAFDLWHCACQWHAGNQLISIIEPSSMKRTSDVVFEARGRAIWKVDHF